MWGGGAEWAAWGGEAWVVGIAKRGADHWVGQTRMSGDVGHDNVSRLGR